MSRGANTLTIAIALFDPKETFCKYHYLLVGHNAREAAAFSLSSQSDCYNFRLENRGVPMADGEAIAVVRDQLLRDRQALLDLSTRNRLLNVPLKTTHAFAQSRLLMKKPSKCSDYLPKIERLRSCRADSSQKRNAPTFIPRIAKLEAFLSRRMETH
jgi:hypothetical protein